jgi:hypothetical protein
VNRIIIRGVANQGLKKYPRAKLVAGIERCKWQRNQCWMIIGEAISDNLKYLPEMVGSSSLNYSLQPLN